MEANGTNGTTGVLSARMTTYPKGGWELINVQSPDDSDPPGCMPSITDEQGFFHLDLATVQWVKEVCEWVLANRSDAELEMLSKQEILANAPGMFNQIAWPITGEVKP
ncbi:MAG TPA: hypothetical protein VIY48_14780 [Candidatus Paceibacterota bacterium]